MKIFIKALSAVIILFIVIDTFVCIQISAAVNQSDVDTYFEVGEKKDGYSTSDDFEYIVLENGTARITSCVHPTKTVYFPTYIDGYIVSSIQSDYGVGTTVGDYKNIFGDGYGIDTTIVEEVILPEKLSEIGGCAFANCVNIKHMELPDSVTYIGDDAFHKCTSLVSINLPYGIEELRGAFSLCENLQSIVIPESIKLIDHACFYGCSSINSIIVPDSVTSIWSEWPVAGTFACCTGLKTIVLGNGLTVINGPSLISLEGGAFYGCSSLTDVRIGSSVHKIERFAFCNCNMLQTIIVPMNVLEIGDYALGFSSESWFTIEDDLHKLDGFTIIGYKNSEAEKYADKYGFAFVDIEICITIGDTDRDGEVTIFDVTAIQRHIAELSTLSYDESAADADEDGEVTILDATAIQRHLANLPTNNKIGQLISM